MRIGKVVQPTHTVEQRVHQLVPNSARPLVQPIPVPPVVPTPVEALNTLVRAFRAGQ